MNLGIIVEFNHFDHASGDEFTEQIGIATAAALPFL
jgi:hypothetical protein